MTVRLTDRKKNVQVGGKTAENHLQRFQFVDLSSLADGLSLIFLIFLIFLTQSGMSNRSAEELHPQSYFGQM